MQNVIYIYSIHVQEESKLLKRKRILATGQERSVMLTKRGMLEIVTCNITRTVYLVDEQREIGKYW